MPPICKAYKYQQWKVDRYDTDHMILQAAVNAIENKLYCFIQNPVFPNNVVIGGNLTVQGNTTLNNLLVNGISVVNGQITFNGNVVFNGDVEQVTQSVQSFKVGDCQNDLFRTRAQVEQYWTNQAPNCQDIYFDKKTAVGDLRWQQDIRFDNLVSSGTLTQSNFLDDNGSGDTLNYKGYQLGNFQSQWQLTNNVNVQFQEQFNNIYQKQWDANEVGQSYQEQEQYQTNSLSPALDQWQINLSNGNWQYQKLDQVTGVTNIPSYNFQKQLSNDYLSITEIDQVSGNLTSNIQRQTQINNGIVQTSVIKITGGNGAYSFQEVLDTTKAQFIESWTYLGGKSFDIEYDSSLPFDHGKISTSNSDLVISTLTSGIIRLEPINELYLYSVSGDVYLGPKNGNAGGQVLPRNDANTDLGSTGNPFGRFRNFYQSGFHRIGSTVAVQYINISAIPNLINSVGLDLTIQTDSAKDLILSPNLGGSNGLVRPLLDANTDLGSLTFRFRNLRLSGSATLSGLTATGAVDFSGATSYKPIFTVALVEPVLTDGEARFWRDTTNNKTYLIARYSGTQYKVELT